MAFIITGYLFNSSYNLLITGLQCSTPKALLGRLMSMILLANMSMMPISQALSGAALRWSLTAVFVTAGLI
jgi:hypothetical protein